MDPTGVWADLEDGLPGWTVKIGDRINTIFKSHENIGHLEGGGANYSTNFY